MLEADRISNLPNEILCEILSLLPTKVACTTSILSKRWISLCYSLNSLHFEDSVPSKKDVPRNAETCLRFVDTFMHSQHHPIKTFRLMCHSEDFADLKILNVADKWVEAATQRRVENFEICIQDLLISPQLRCFQDNLLAYDLIHHDEPRNHDVAFAIEVVKTSWSKRLQLVENLQLPPNIFTCKTLVVLKLSGLIVGTNVCYVDLPALKTLHLMEVSFRERKNFMILLSGCPNLEDLHASTVTHLQQACIIGGFRNFPNLVRADIRALHVPLTIFYNVQFLHLEGVEYLYCYRMPEFNKNPNQGYYTAIPMFHNLIHIELCTLTFRVVLKLLTHCPKLQILVTKECFGDRYPTFAPPKCISLHLKTCSMVNNERNYSTDFQFASYIMKNTSLLQAMTIYNLRYQDPEKKRHDLEKLHSLCPVIPSTCKISLTSCISGLD